MMNDQTINLLKQNFFEVFNLQQSFELDLAALQEQYRALQAVSHPDRFAHASPEEQRLAVQQAAHINEGVTTLKNPLSRARYLLELSGIEMDDTDTQMEPAFLMQQMELHETLASAKGADDPFTVTAKVLTTVKTIKKELIVQLVSDFSAGTFASLSQARQRVRKLQFLDKLAIEVGQLEEEIGELY